VLPVALATGHARASPSDGQLTCHVSTTHPSHWRKWLSTWRAVDLILHPDIQLIRAQNLLKAQRTLTQSEHTPRGSTSCTETKTTGQIDTRFEQHLWDFYFRLLPSNEYWFLVLGILHDVQGKFSCDVSGASVGPIFTGHVFYALTHDQWRWDPTAAPETLSGNLPRPPCKVPKTKKECQHLREFTFCICWNMHHFELHVQGGSNMTGTNCDSFTHK
jgi:hypothetical protein